MDYFRRKYAQFIRKVFLWSLKKMENYMPFKDSYCKIGDFVGLYHRRLSEDHIINTPQKKDDLVIIIDTKFIDYYKKKQTKYMIKCKYCGGKGHRPKPLGKRNIIEVRGECCNGTGQIPNSNLI